MYLGKLFTTQHLRVRVRNISAKTVSSWRHARARAAGLTRSIVLTLDSYDHNSILSRSGRAVALTKRIRTFKKEGREGEGLFSPVFLSAF